MPLITFWEGSRFSSPAYVFDSAVLSRMSDDEGCWVIFDLFAYKHIKLHKTYPLWRFRQLGPSCCWKLLHFFLFGDKKFSFNFSLDIKLLCFERIHIWFPAKDNWVGSSSDEIVTVCWKVGRSSRTFVAIQSVKDTALSQVPNLNCRVIWGRNKTCSCIIEGDRIDAIVMSIVVLQESLRSAVKDLNFFIGATGCQASAIRMEFDLIDHASVVSVTMNHGSTMCNIPQPDSPIVTTRSHHPGITGKLRGFYPVLMACKCLQEFEIPHGPHLHQFVVWGRNKLRSVSIEWDGFYRSRMTLQNIAVGWGIVVPNPDGGVPRATGYQTARWIDRNIVYWTFMPNELVCPRVCFKGSRQNYAVVWTWNNLLHIWTKNALRNFVPVLQEWLD